MLRLRLQRFCSRKTPDEIAARQQTLNLIDRSPEFLKGSSTMARFNPEVYLQNHPNQEHALNIRNQMNEIAELIEKMKAREHSGNKFIVLAATAFLTCSAGYTMFQFADVNTSFTSSLPSLFSFLEYSTARKLLCYMAQWDMLPVDFGSDDPYMVRIFGRSSRHPLTRPLRVCVPLGLGAGMDVDASGPAAFLKLGFGLIEVGSVNIQPSDGEKLNNVQSLGYTLAYDMSRQDPSKGLPYVSNRLCDYIESRKDDLLTRNTVTCLTISTRNCTDVRCIFSDTRLIATADSIAFDLTHVSDDTQLLSIIECIEKEAMKADLIPVLLLRIGLRHSLPPPTSVASAIKSSRAIVGVSINGTGTACGNNKVTKLPQTDEMQVSGQITKDRSTEAVAEWYKALDCPNTHKEIVSSGGVFCGKDALDKIEAGASIVNVFTAFVLDGFPVARRIKTQLSVQLMNKGYYNIEEAIGAKHRQTTGRLKRSFQRRKRF